MSHAHPYPGPPGRTAAPPPAPVPLRRTRLAFGLVATGLAASAGLVLLVGNSFPYGHFGLALIGVGLGLVAVVAWLVALVLALGARRFSPHLVVPPVVAALVLGLVALDVPLRARFALSRPAFEQLVADRGEGGLGAPCPARVGLYRVHSCRTSTVTRFATEGGFLDLVGFAYAPEGVPPPSGGDGSVTYEPLIGPWYIFREFL